MKPKLNPGQKIIVKFSHSEQLIGEIIEILDGKTGMIWSDIIRVDFGNDLIKRVNPNQITFI